MNKLDDLAQTITSGVAYWMNENMIDRNGQVDTSEALNIITSAYLTSLFNLMSMIGDNADDTKTMFKVNEFQKNISDAVRNTSFIKSMDIQRG